MNMQVWSSSRPARLLLEFEREQYEPRNSVVDLVIIDG